MEMFEQLLMVAMVLAVLCGGLWLLKRKGWAYTALRTPRGDGQPRLEVLDRLALSPHHWRTAPCSSASRPTAAIFSKARPPPR